MALGGTHLTAFLIAYGRGLPPPTTHCYQQALFPSHEMAVEEELKERVKIVVEFTDSFSLIFYHSNRCVLSVVVFFCNTTRIVHAFEECSDDR